MFPEAVQQDKRSKQRIVAIILGIVCLIAALIFGVVQGSVKFSVAEIYQSILAPLDSESYRIIYHLRIPRVITAALVGSNLALAGCILQGVLRNPLADPGIIGVSSGAGLAAMLIMILLPEYTGLIPIAAFVGALVATCVVFALSWERGKIRYG